jgi:hypothetical protein
MPTRMLINSFAHDDFAQLKVVCLRPNWLDGTDQTSVDSDTILQQTPSILRRCTEVLFPSQPASECET